MPPPPGLEDGPAGALVASAGALALEEDDALVQLKAEEANDAAVDAAAAAAARSGSDLRVLVAPTGGGGAPAAAAAAAATSAAVASAGAVTAAAAAAAGRQQQEEKQAGEGAGDLDAELDAAIDQFQQLYHDAYLGRGLQHLDEFASAHPGLSASKLSDRLRARHGLDLALLRRRSELVAMGLRECANDEGWRLIQDVPGGLRLLYRHGPQTETAHCFKAACELDCELPELLSMAREFDLVPTWNSYITQTDILQITSLVELLVYASVWIPWPFAHRDVLIQAVGMDMLAEDGSVAISFASPEAGMPEDVEPPAGYEGRTHVQILPGSCLRMVPLPPKSPGGKTRTGVVVVTMLDSGAWVPEAIITFVLSVFAPFFYTAVRNVIDSAFDDPSSPLPQRIAGRGELYGVMAERIVHFLSGKPDEP
ncbi:hypothetical protein Rsub_02450 [Raphidocelis subcapitata]|uniref:START domain-containing protein n=1 Tax=Raphidocelis subcapitata TaxID=307507 RepID=A0A2V0NRT7_9CHLO|nr:hypothetical protein Rsub_02450 [Raphidocelis subcapitata]|eukprot:GBF90344.1 hypothetical protein Rsub_02450 [Raphidocelis subcapitata]